MDNAVRDAFYETIEPEGMTALWSVMGDLVTRAPNSDGSLFERLPFMVEAIDATKAQSSEKFIAPMLLMPTGKSVASTRSTSQDSKLTSRGGPRQFRNP